MMVVEGFVSYSHLFQAGDEIVLSFPVVLRRFPEMKRDDRLFTYRHGSLLLGVDSEQENLAIGKKASPRYLGDGVYQFDNESIKLIPVNQLFFKETVEAKKDRKIVIFSEGGV